MQLYLEENTETTTTTKLLHNLILLKGFYGSLKENSVFKAITRRSLGTEINNGPGYLSFQNPVRNEGVDVLLLGLITINLALKIQK